MSFAYLPFVFDELNETMARGGHKIGRIYLTNCYVKIGGSNLNGKTNLAKELPQDVNYAQQDILLIHSLKDLVSQLS